MDCNIRVWLVIAVKWVTWITFVSNKNGLLDFNSNHSTPTSTCHSVAHRTQAGSVDPVGPAAGGLTRSGRTTTCHLPICGDAQSDVVMGRHYGLDWLRAKRRRRRSAGEVVETFLLWNVCVLIACVVIPSIHSRPQSPHLTKPGLCPSHHHHYHQHHHKVMIHCSSESDASLYCVSCRRPQRQHIISLWPSTMSCLSIIPTPSLICRL